MILTASGLTRRFGDFTALDSFTITVREGEAFGLLGPNGAGKTTAIRMLTTLLVPTAGTASVAGFDIRRQPGEVRRVIGYVPQALSVDGSLTAWENLLLFAKLYDIPRRERPSRIEGALALVGLTEVAGKLVRELSGGMIRRLEIAQSTLHRPRLLFLDEPTVGLDPGARAAVWEHIRRLRADLGTTIFLTTHSMEEADELCGRLVILHHGRIAAEGTPADLTASLGRPDATLNDVFLHVAGEEIETGGSASGYREISRGRRDARRRG